MVPLIRMSKSVELKMGYIMSVGDDSVGEISRTRRDGIYFVFQMYLNFKYVLTFEFGNFQWTDEI